jgi:hypothetical protein
MSIRSFRYAAELLCISDHRQELSDPRARSLYASRGMLCSKTHSEYLAQPIGVERDASRKSDK